MTRPGTLALVPAARGDWMAREQLATLLWPEAAPPEAQHRLRHTLHRCRALLQGWGVADALQAERSRLRLPLPTDLPGAGSPDSAPGLASLPALPGMPASAPRALPGREALQDLPYRALADLLREHGAALRAALAAAPTSPRAAHRLDLARLMPELAPGEALPPLEPLTARARLAEALALALAVESLGPWLLVDDLPWCDEASLGVLGLLAHRGRTRWIAGARPQADGGGRAGGHPPPCRLRPAGSVRCRIAPPGIGPPVETVLKRRLASMRGSTSPELAACDIFRPARPSSPWPAPA